jgi:hypothetical protein
LVIGAWSLDVFSNPTPAPGSFIPNSHAFPNHQSTMSPLRYRCAPSTFLSRSARQVPQKTRRLRPKPVALAKTREFFTLHLSPWQKHGSFVRAPAETKPKSDTSVEEPVLELSAKSQIRGVWSRTVNEIVVFCRSAGHMGLKNWVSFGTGNRVSQSVPKLQKASCSPSSGFVPKMPKTLGG